MAVNRVAASPLSRPFDPSRSATESAAGSGKSGPLSMSGTREHAQQLLQDGSPPWLETRCSGMLDPIDMDFKKQFLEEAISCKN